MLAAGLKLCTLLMSLPTPVMADALDAVDAVLAEVAVAAFPVKLP